MIPYQALWHSHLVSVPGVFGVEQLELFRNLHNCVSTEFLSRTPLERDLT
jgi:hypothetical protein